MIQTKVKIRGYHLDLYGHVNNARYLELLEEGRWDYLDQKKISLGEFQKRQLTFAVVNININYRNPARLGDTVIIETSDIIYGNKSAAFDQKIVIENKNQVAADAKVTFVIIDEKTGRAASMEETLKQMATTTKP